MKLSRRQCLGGFAAAAAIVPQFAAIARPAPRPVAPSGPVTPEQFGAVGDGLTNDTDAFAAMTSFINRQGGGTIALRPTTYVVGKQSRNVKTGYAFAPASIMNFAGCTKPLVLNGNGAVLRCASGLRFGTFDPRTGTPTQHSQPYYVKGELSSPYFAMLLVQNCSGGVIIQNLELDGNIAAMKIGGPWGDTGWQIPCTGLILQNNGGPIAVASLRSHHHGQDGGMGDGHGLVGNPEQVKLSDCEFYSNGRNAWSMVGGIGWTFERCKFNKSARDLPFAGSSPAAGIDFEAEGGKYVGQIHLTDCIAEDNLQVACLNAPTGGRVSDVYWEGGRIEGTTLWSYYGCGNEAIRFRDTLFLGALVNLTKETFESCTFSDDVTQSSTGSLYNPYGFIIPDSKPTNLFTNCEIIHARPEGSTNGGWDAAIFENCVFRSRPGAGKLDVYGHFRGTNTEFIAEKGGVDFDVIPGAQAGGFTDAGGADDPFTVTSTTGQTVTYPANR